MPTKVMKMVRFLFIFASKSITYIRVTHTHTTTTRGATIDGFLKTFPLIWLPICMSLFMLGRGSCHRKLEESKHIN